MDSFEKTSVKPIKNRVRSSPDGERITLFLCIMNTFKAIKNDINEIYGTPKRFL